AFEECDERKFIHRSDATAARFAPADTTYDHRGAGDETDAHEKAARSARRTSEEREQGAERSSHGRSVRGRIGSAVFIATRRRIRISVEPFRKRRGVAVSVLHSRTSQLPSPGLWRGDRVAEGTRLLSGRGSK